MKHNAQSSQALHSGFHVYAKQNGYRIKVAVRGEFVYVWLNKP